MRLVRRPRLPGHTAALPGPPVLVVISALPFRGCPSPPSQDRAVSGAVASICPRQSQVPLVPPRPCSLPSCRINCLKHFLDSRGVFCSLSLLFSMAAPLPAPLPAQPSPCAGAASSSSPLPVTKGSSSHFPELKMTCQVMWCHCQRACRLLCIPHKHRPIFLYSFCTCKPVGN